MARFKISCVYRGQINILDPTHFSSFSVEGGIHTYMAAYHGDDIFSDFQGADLTIYVQ